MVAAAVAAGRGSGLRVGLESARQRRIEEEEIKRRREREDFNLERARTTAEWQDEDRPRNVAADELAIESGELGVEAQRFGLDRSRTTAGYVDEDRPRDVAAQELGLESARFGMDRQRTEASRSDERYAMDQQEFQRRSQQEGVADFVNALGAGVDLPYAINRFNERGEWKIDPAKSQFNQETGTYRFVDNEGETFEGTAEQFAAAMGVQMTQPEPMKLGKDDRLVDPGTGREIVGPSGGAGGGRDVSPYNPQTVQDDLTAGIVRSMGGEFDAYGRYSFGSDADRALGDYRIALAQDMAGRHEELLKSTRVTPGQIVQTVMEATKDVPGEGELASRAEQWRTKGFNKSQEEAAEWLSAERNRLRSEADARIAEAEQSLIGENARPSAFRTPEWAGDAMPDVDPGQLEPGYEYDVDIDGRKTSVRLGPDGKVYEVKGAAKAAEEAAAKASTKRKEVVDSSLANARSRSEFVY
jgi:hypothetical protein